MDDPDVSRRRNWTEPASVGVVVACAAGAVYGWIHLERTEDVGPGILWYCGSMVAAVVLNASLRVVSEPDGIRATLRRILSSGRLDSVRAQLRAWSLPGALTWLLPVLVLPVLLALLPIAFHTSPGDGSIVGVAFAFTVLLGPLALLIGFLVWGMVGFPLLLLLRVLTRAMTRHRVGDEDLAALGFGGLLLSIIAFAIAVVAAAPDSSERSTRTANANQFAALIGFDNSHVTHPALLWVARVAVLAVIACVVVVRRAMGKRVG